MKNKNRKDIFVEGRDLSTRLSKNQKKVSGVHGFTLIEVIISMFIFVVVIAGSTVVFASTFKSYGKAKAMQENMENAQYAMNLMAKTLRTSSVADDSDTPWAVTVFDYSQGACIKYEFDGSDLMRYVGSVSDLSGCESFSFGSGVPMTSGTVTGNFSVTKSDNTTVGKIIVFMEVSDDKDKVHMQTTTSLRDYVESGITL